MKERIKTFGIAVDGGRTLVPHHGFRRRSGTPGRLYNALGFTAGEVLVAAAVLAIVLMAVAGMFVSGTRDIQIGANRSRATFFAQQKLEELRNVPAFPPAPVSPAAPASDSPAPGFTRNWVVPTVTGSTPSRLATVSVVVSWTDQTGPKSVQSVTYLPEP
ncbi:MAG: hypothetical protein ACE5IQ_05900 [Candidatus Methylomirabilales bacterium]